MYFRKLVEPRISPRLLEGPRPHVNDHFVSDKRELQSPRGEPRIAKVRSAIVADRCSLVIVFVNHTSYHDGNKYKTNQR